IVALESGAEYIGKSLEWGTAVFVYDAGGRRRELHAADVTSIQTRRDAAVTTRPTQPDLTVAFVERSRAEAGSVAPLALKLHVLNAGGAVARPFDYRITVDGEAGPAGRVEQAIPAGQEYVVDASVPAPTGAAGGLRIELDVKKENLEIERWNDTFEESLGAIDLSVIVAKSAREAFRNVRNGVDPFCVEDWLQYHARLFNELLARSEYSSTPNGIGLRVRIQSLVEEDFTVNSDGASLERLRQKHPGQRVLVFNGASKDVEP